jgi:hypothetical protein
VASVENEAPGFHSFPNVLILLSHPKSDPMLSGLVMRIREVVEMLSKHHVGATSKPMV